MSMNASHTRVPPSAYKLCAGVLTGGIITESRSHTCMRAHSYREGETHTYAHAHSQVSLSSQGPHLLIQIFDKARHSAALHAIRRQSK